MPAHRSSCFIVIREITELLVGQKTFVFDAVVGAYGSINRADEMCGVSAQALLDAGANKGDYRFTVKASNYYDE